jgi:hypothetical protein
MIDLWKYVHHICCEGNATPNSRRVTQYIITNATGVQVKTLLISGISNAYDEQVMPGYNSDEWFHTYSHCNWRGSNVKWLIPEDQVMAIKLLHFM